MSLGLHAAALTALILFGFRMPVMPPAAEVAMVFPPAPPVAEAAESIPAAPAQAAVPEPSPAAPPPPLPTLRSAPRPVLSPTRAPSLPSPSPVSDPVPAPAPAQEPVIDAIWQASVAAWLAAHKTYPDDARRRGEEGRVAIRFTVDHAGHVLDATLASSSGSDRLDAATLALLRGARLPGLPASMPQDRVTITTGVRFNLR